MTEWRVTPSLRLAAFSHLNKNGDEIFVADDLQTKLCKHGETGSTIRTWLYAEARARAAGEPPPERPSVCDCTSTHGLQLKVDTRPPPPPPCVYDALAAAGAETLAVDGENGPACRLLGGFVGPSGALYCQHGRRMQMQRRGPAVRPYVFCVRGGCDCTLRLPKRAGAGRRRLGLGR